MGPETARRLRWLGALALVAAVIIVVIVVAKSTGQPNAAACATIRNINNGLGLPPANCGWSGTGYWVTAGICAAAGLLLLFLVPSSPAAEHPDAE